MEKAGTDSIACEISITSTPDYEIQNLQKCLDAGYQKIVLLLPERRSLQKIEKLAKDKWTETDLQKITFIPPDEFFPLLEKLAPAIEGQPTVKGYKVKTSTKFPSPEEEEAKKKAIMDSIWGSIRKKDQKDT